MVDLCSSQVSRDSINFSFLLPSGPFYFQKSIRVEKRRSVSLLCNRCKWIDKFIRSRRIEESYNIQGVGHTSGADCTSKNNEKKAYEYNFELNFLFQLLLQKTLEMTTLHLKTSVYESCHRSGYSFYHSWYFSKLSEALLYSIS